MIAGKNEIMFANAQVPARWGWSELLTKRAELDSVGLALRRQDRCTASLAERDGN